MRGNIFAILLLGLSWPADSQIRIETLGKSLKAIDTKTLTDADCISQIAKAEVSNGPELIYGGQVCNALGQPEDSSLLMVAGQIRAGADLLLLPPATKADDQALMDLYSLLYFGGGVAGVNDEVLRAPQSRERFLKAFEEWTPTYPSNYDPGWNFRKRPDPGKYQSTVSQAKADLSKYFDRVVRLVSDDQYYSLHREFMQLLERNPQGIAPDSTEGRRLDELESKIRDRMIVLGVDPGPSPKQVVAEAERDRIETANIFPPASPQPNEQILSTLNSPVVERCADLGERMAISRGGKIVRVHVTSSQKWGPIWRADIEGGDSEPERFTCTETTSSSEPLEAKKLPPLPISDTTPQ